MMGPVGRCLETALDELLAEDPSQRGTALDQALQMMDFAQAGALVREALRD